MLFLDDVVNSLLKGENVGITRRNNRNTSNPAVTTQASSTTHTRPIPRSHSPSHAPTSQQTIVSNKKKRSKDKDVTPAPTPPAAEQPEKADKTLGEPPVPGICHNVIFLLNIVLVFQTQR
ncbi:uncharacterized protein [Diadema antillarum]|uniref:uncharacterized protein isoform X2 n=1 Tax=Diadema antillarum TaxID=105358 RepID=UPI003A8BB194